MSSAQDRTLAQYLGLMQVNASSHLLRAARQLGIVDQLRDGQKTSQQLYESLSLLPESADLLMKSLLAIGIVEQYGDDFALSRAGHLLCQYDEDLGDAQWERLTDLIRGDQKRDRHDDERRLEYLAATQWIHTPSAMQAAEMLDIGQEGQFCGLKILDLGCGSGVWSCAMAYRDPDSTVVAVDATGPLQAARSTADAIELGERFQTIDSKPSEVALPADDFDLVVLAQRIGNLGKEAANQLLHQAIAATKPGGRLVVIDQFYGPGKASLADTIEAVRLDLATQQGSIRTLAEIQDLMNTAGLEAVQFTFLAASRTSMGLVVGVKPTK